MSLAKLTYFRGRGRAETTRWMLAVTRTAFVNIPIDTPEDLAELRASGALPFDQMPLLEVDGRNLSQSSAMIRYLARRGGLYGSDDTDAMWCDMISGVVADFAETALQAAFKPSVELGVADMTARFAKFGPRFEARIREQGSGYIAADTMTFADVVLAEALSAYLEWCPEILAQTPLLEALYSRVIITPGIVAYLASDLRYPKSDDDYVIAAARVLQRALPAHMPDANRFVAERTAC
ncbi:glutathione S-transferase family protein [Thalassobaculum sp.]|uniref:glutathione S-transferase family protein n=1 Tax=Thalassobaculum sp. TaxID=2022740 RepID=UPI0032EAB893